MTDKEAIKNICLEKTNAIVNFPDIDMPKFLWAIAGVESSWTLKPKPRIEPAYSPPRGKYWLNNLKLVKLRSTYGELVSASLGPFQVMYPTARELGFRFSPKELEDLKENHYYACIYFKKRCKPKNGEKITPEMLADAYNSGNYRDNIIPKEYVEKVMRYYKGEW